MEFVNNKNVERKIQQHMQEIAKDCQFVENPPKSFATRFPHYPLGDVQKIQQIAKYVQNSPKI